VAAEWERKCAVDRVDTKAQSEATDSDQDVLLIAAAKNNDKDAFGLLVGRHRKAILLRALRVTGNYEDAEDVVQLVFQKAFVHLHNFEGRSSFSTWLTRIALNEALMLMRKHRRSRVALNYETTLASDYDPVIQIADHGPSPENICCQRERCRLLIAAIVELKTQLRVPLQACVLGELPQHEVAQQLGISISALKSRLNRGRKTLRNRLKASIAVPGRPAASNRD
jgi:RNA polymerase sigma-70 factor, ECF subfamily